MTTRTDSNVDIEKLRKMVHEGDLLVAEQVSQARRVGEVLMGLAKANLKDAEASHARGSPSPALEKGVLSPLNVLVEYLEKSEEGGD